MLCSVVSIVLLTGTPGGCLSRGSVDPPARGARSLESFKFVSICVPIAHIFDEVSEAIQLSLYLAMLEASAIEHVF